MGRTAFIVLPDEHVNDTAENVLTFSNRANPPHSWWWGVGHVRIADRIPLPSSEFYGNLMQVPGGDLSHADSVAFSFPGTAGDQILAYQCRPCQRLYDGLHHGP